MYVCFAIIFFKLPVTVVLPNSIQTLKNQLKNSYNSRKLVSKVAVIKLQPTRHRVLQ